jgi:hypothetical protein
MHDIDRDQPQAIEACGAATHTDRQPQREWTASALRYGTRTGGASRVVGLCAT